jgi:hypothetical protein
MIFSNKFNLFWTTNLFLYVAILKCTFPPFSHLGSGGWIQPLNF